MTDLTLRNALTYLALWVLNALIGCLALAVATGKLWGFGEGGFFEPIAPSLAAGLTLIGSGLALWLAANRPKLGREDVSALVREIGTIRARAILADVLHGYQPSAPALTDDDLDRLADHIYERIEARMLAAPAEGRG